jgi:hypothetical protein
MTSPQLVWPQCMLRPSEWTWSIDGAFVVGGQPISGPPQTAEISTGGSWMYEHQVAILRTPAEVGTYRALLSQLFQGRRTLIVPVIDALKPVPPGLVPWSDPAPFSDLSEWAGGLVKAFLATAGYMPASPPPPSPPNQAQITITTGQALQGAEYFSVSGPSGAKRLHLIHSILATTTNADGSVTYTVEFNPPFREDMAALTPVDFDTPGCTMKVDVASVKDAWPRMGVRFFAQPKITFREGGFVTPS